MRDVTHLVFLGNKANNDKAGFCYFLFFLRNPMRYSSPVYNGSTPSHMRHVAILPFKFEMGLNFSD